MTMIRAVSYEVEHDGQVTTIKDLGPTERSHCRPEMRWVAAYRIECSGPSADIAKGNLIRNLRSMADALEGASKV